jgi:hypothetical protein
MILRTWRALNRWPWHGRCPLKILLLVIVVFFTLYPKFWLLPRTIERYGDMNSVLDPTYPELAPLEEQVRSELPASADAKATLAAVQKAVYQRIPYAWDWDIWGNCDYLPTVAEVFQKGREDCDGQAVVAASLLRRMGIQANLVSDILHVWVDTPRGETMSPTGGEKTLVGTPSGTRPNYSWKLLNNLGRGVSYGVAVFPIPREIIILVTLCALAIQPRSSFWRRVAGCLILWIAWGMLRDAGRQAAIQGQWLDVLHAWTGVALVLVGVLVLAIRAGAAPPRSAANTPE